MNNTADSPPTSFCLDEALEASVLLERLARNPCLAQLVALAESGQHVDAFSAPISTHACIASLMSKHIGRPLALICDGLKHQESVLQDLNTWMIRIDAESEAKSSIQDLYFFPAWEVLPHDTKLPHVDVISDRLSCLSSLLRAKSDHSGLHHPIVVTSIVALMQATFKKDKLNSISRTIKTGDILDPLDLVEWLEDQGYEPEAQVSQKGELSMRGGILDVFPPTFARPIRLEFFGNEVESMRSFDPATQVSEQSIREVYLSPAGELGLLRRHVQKELSSNASQSDSGAGTTTVSSPNAATSPGFGSLIDYLPSNTVFVVLDPPSVHHHACDYSRQVPERDPLFLSIAELKLKLTSGGRTVVRLFGDGALTTETGEHRRNSADVLPDFWSAEEPPGLSVDSWPSIDLEFQTLEAYRPINDQRPDPVVAEQQRKMFLDQMLRWQRQEHRVQVCCNNAGESQRFLEIWKEHTHGQPQEYVSNPKPFTLPALQIGIMPLARGFLCTRSKTVLVTDAEVFGRYKIQRSRRLRVAQYTATKSLAEVGTAELEFGDYVVHIQHGIGKYLGLQVLPPHRRKGEAIESSSGGQECLVIEYAPASDDQPPPKLFVPINEVHLVSKYIGAGKARPQLNTLGTARWGKTKDLAEKAVRDLAAELLSIQAARDSQTGHVFPSDTQWQKEFEASFLYEETPDQIRAIDSVKKDMESPKPMDRLICGDVGFGKTEVAIRAIFKAVMGGKQVAVLVPTTVLAQQHFNTLQDRMADYPIRIDLLSRFRSPKQQRKTIADLENGTIDIVVGTHRIIQSDVVFKDLGLVVIDEEQRFGVTHKERFKQLRRLVEVLTLSATPIPRTLYLALSGARDLSTIETPPQDRLPVETILAPYDERLIRDAIQREINREGQVYFLHNRVATIDAVAIKLKALLPQARVLVGHGQMDPDDLEKVMTRFVNGEADVLLCTTIIESGLDIPNANTIIIDRADRFGLSELYQLRGRVGRYKHQAYAFLLLPRHAGLLSDARKRLAAIKQYSTLGSGFKIAMRDLELRGAGNLLGPQQSGHIAAIGFELYCQLLKQSIAVQRGENVKSRIEVQWRVDFLFLSPTPASSHAPESQNNATPSKPNREKFDIHIPREVATYLSDSESDQTVPSPETHLDVKPAYAYLPSSYLTDPKSRIEIYRKLAQTQDKAGLEQIKTEVRDRFGPMPIAVELLFTAHELKLMAAARGITAIESKQDRLMLMRNRDWIMIGGRFPRLTKREPKARLVEIRRFLSAI